MQKQGQQVEAQPSIPETCSRAAEGNEPQKHLQSEQQKADGRSGSWGLEHGQAGRPEWRTAEVLVDARDAVEGDSAGFVEGKTSPQ